MHSRARRFADVPLGVIPIQIATLVSSRGRVPIADLPSLFVERFGIQIDERDEKWLNRFGWSAVGRRFVKWNDEETDLLPGDKEARVLDPPGSWTFAEIEALAKQLYEAGTKKNALFESVIEIVHPGKRAPRLIARVVGSAIYAAEHGRKSEG